MKNLALLFLFGIVFLFIPVAKSVAFLPSDGFTYGYGSMDLLERNDTTWVMSNFNPPLIAGDNLNNDPGNFDQVTNICNAANPTHCDGDGQGVTNAIEDIAGNKVTFTMDPSIQAAINEGNNYYLADYLSSLGFTNCDDTTGPPCREWSNEPAGTPYDPISSETPNPITTADVETPTSTGYYTDPITTFSDPTTVTLSAVTSTGATIANTYYTIDGGSQQTYSIPFTITGEGSHTITYWSVDNDGNQEAANSDTFTIAETTPTPSPTPTLTPTPSPTTLTPSQDAYIQHNAQNANEGAASYLELSYEGKERTLVQFNESQIAAAVAGDPDFTATFKLTIVSNNNNWGSSGRQIDVNRMEQSWTEGNGSYKENGNRGTGSGVTWNCATDSNIANSSTNCSGSTAWDMIDIGSWPFASTPTATSTISNGQSGVVSFDVTSDVQSFLNDTNTNDGWIIKKDNETQGGDVQFSSSEGSSSPKLIITPH